MRRAFSIGFLSMVALASGAGLGQERDKVYQNRTDPRPAAGADNSGNANTPAANRTNRWRYRFHNDQWWYYHPNGQWSYWNGNAWVAYRRRMYAPPSDVPPRPDGDRYRYGVGFRAPGLIQREKNETRGEELEPSDLRPSGTIQREKNESRGPSESMGLRPEGTIQREKNESRARD
jgi:hypothetical protein